MDKVFLVSVYVLKGKVRVCFAWLCLFFWTLLDWFLIWLATITRAV